MNRSKCKNCGASLEYNRKENVAKCPYCRTTYHLDDLGRIEEYKVKLEFMGRVMLFYIESWEIEPLFVDTTSICDNVRTYISQSSPIRLSLISYDDKII